MSLRKITLGVVAALASLVMLTGQAGAAVPHMVRVTSAAQIAQIGVPYYFVNSATNRCLAVQGANNVNGAPAFQYDCLNSADQGWHNGTSYPWAPLTNTQTGRCLAFQGSNHGNGAPAFQYDCLNSADQNWDWMDNGNNTFTLVNQATGKCLAVQGANNVNGAPAFQYDCLGSADQAWYVYYIS